MTGEFSATLEGVEAAIAAMGTGDPQPYKACWATSPDATLFGAWGPIEKGHEAVTSTFEWVGSRFSDGTLASDYSVVDSSGDLAYTVGFERGMTRVDGGELRPMTIRVTHIYKRIDGEWRIVHRHGDFPPEDQRPRSKPPVRAT